MMFDAHSLIDGSVCVYGSTGIRTGFGSLPIAETIHLTTSNDATCQGKRVDTAMMVTTAILVDLRRAAKVGEKYNRRFLPHASHLEVGEQGGDATTKYGEETILHLRKVPPVGVPVVTTATG
jgi:hypothetical protein